MTRILGALAAVVVCIGQSGPALADHVPDGRSVHKMVFQMNADDPKLWSLMLNNINNIITEMGKDHVDIKVVSYGPGINMFRKDKSSVLDRLESLKKLAGKSVEYTVCSNTMKAMGVDSGRSSSSWTICTPVSCGSSSCRSGDTCTSGHEPEPSGEIPCRFARHFWAEAGGCSSPPAAFLTGPVGIVG